jgi:nucleoid-associated protein YgaU
MSQLNSRYALTPLVTDPVRNVRRTGPWVPPTISRVGATFYTVTSADIRRLDNLSYRFYGDPTLWWVLALVNAIANPLTDMVVGQVLTIPTANAVTTALTGG